jgi:hypothetical protein
VAIKKSMFQWLANSGQDLLRNMDASAAPLNALAIEQEVRRHGYTAARAAMLSLINRRPELAAAMPMVAYTLLAVFCCAVYIFEKMDTTDSIFGEVLYIIGLLLWGGIVSFGVQLKLMRLKHQLRVVSPCPCSTSWIVWVVGIGTGCEFSTTSVFVLFPMRSPLNRGHLVILVRRRPLVDAGRNLLVARQLQGKVGADLSCAGPGGILWCGDNLSVRYYGNRRPACHALHSGRLAA